MAHAILPLLLIWVTTTVAAATSDTPITCEAGLCTAGTRTSVTCNFNEDISVSRHAFSVVRYPLNASRDDIGTTVLSCSWPESGTRPVCQVKDDFSFNHNVTDRLTLEIPVATEETTGPCACSVVPNSHGRPVQACNLTVKSVGEEEVRSDSGSLTMGVKIAIAGLSFSIGLIFVFITAAYIASKIVRRKCRRTDSTSPERNGRSDSSTHEGEEREPMTDVNETNVVV